MLAERCIAKVKKKKKLGSLEGGIKNPTHATKKQKA
jgi:hypothetical protein